MKFNYLLITIVFVALMYLAESCGPPEVKPPDRMDWWREARFGLFIHWGLYSIPAGEWNGETWHAEWIRTTAQIPLEVYDGFAGQFNPVKFNADEWVRMAKDAGMKYIVITSKHHDGFCLLDSPYTDFDVMSTPFRRDILKELSVACENQGIRLCFYHSIMDWHHPDYLPRREWETDRSTEGADFDRFLTYLKNQLQILTSNYGDIGVLWFDGEWEDTWTHRHGIDLYHYVRSLRPDIIINNRVDKGREGMAGMTADGGYMGDFGTPEQEIPATGIPGSDWESCMTMNDHWGFNKLDSNWKSSQDLIRKLIDIASKGGNFLLNVGPSADGVFPDESIQRLKDIGRWMAVNSESVYGTQASPFKSLKHGRCTRKSAGNNTMLYFHIFDWPADGRLVIPGLDNKVMASFLLGTGEDVRCERRDGEVIIDLTKVNEQEYVTVVAVKIKGSPVIIEAPEIIYSRNIFIDTVTVEFKEVPDVVEIRYTVDGSEPGSDSPVYSSALVLRENSVVTARIFRDGAAVTGSTTAEFMKVEPFPAIPSPGIKKGFQYYYYEGEWDTIPDFSALKPSGKGQIDSISLSPRLRDEHYGFVFDGYIEVPQNGVYTFLIGSDDGSRLTLDDHFVIDNDGLHGMVEKSMDVPLAGGFHKLRVEFFERTGLDDLNVKVSGPF